MAQFQMTFPDALHAAAKHPGTQKVAKDSRGASSELAKNGAHLKGAFGQSFEF